MSDEGIKARLKAAREELGTLELEGLRAIQSAQRCIARGVPALLREVEGPAARAPESHAGGEASALRRAVAALGALS